MKIAELTFPVTPEDFVAYQEAGIGRKLDAGERDALEAWIPIVNQAYENGQGNNCPAMCAVLNCINQCLNESQGRPMLVRFMEAIRWWIVHAWEQGKEAQA